MPVHRRDVILDLTRLATRFSRTTPNGIDRVDLGYARHFLSPTRGGRGLIFGPAGRRALDNRAARAIVDAIGAHWREDGRPEDDETYLELQRSLNGLAELGSSTRRPDKATVGAARSIGRLITSGAVIGGAGLIPGRSLVRTVPEGAVYINANQFPLWMDRYFSWLDRRPDVKAVFFIHDLLPIRYPEFFPPAEAQRHEGRMQVLARRAAAVIVASDHTRHALEQHLAQHGHQAPPIRVIPLPGAAAVAEPAVPALPFPRRAYFIAVGTIEPRKNQLLLLNIWRELAVQLGDRTPSLLLIGSRGWDNENVVDMLERCPVIEPYVHEVANLSTPGLGRVMAGARALLMPTLAEGYGLPVAEALAAGVPVVVSDVPGIALRIGPGTTVLDPLDGPGWRDAIIAHLSGDKPKIPSDAGLTHAAPPTWEWHLGHVEEFIQSF